MTNIEKNIVDTGYYAAKNLREERAVMHAEDIWNPFFLSPADHAQMMDRTYGNGENWNITPSPSVSPEPIVEKTLTPLNNANETKQPRT